MEYTKLKNINFYKSENINPSKYPNDVFEMYSVPIYETGHPEYLRGEEIASSKSLVKKNDILLCKINPRINRVWIVKDESDKINIASSEWIVIRNDEYNPEFLAWYLRSPKFQKLMTSEVTGIGGSLTRAQPKRVAEYPVPVLPLREQNEIANVLNKAKRIIDNRKQELFMLDELIKARFIELFGDPVNNSKAWNVKPLLEMGYCKNGMNFQTGDSGIEMHCLGVGDFNDYSIIDRTDHLPMISLNEEPSEECMLQNGDIVFVRSNGNKNLVGRCVMVYPYDTPTTYSGFCIRYRLTGDEVIGPYLLHVLKMDSMRKKMAGRGANIQNLNQQILASLDIPLPPIALQKQFADFITKIDKSKLLEERQVRFIAKISQKPGRQISFCRFDRFDYN